MEVFDILMLLFAVSDRTVSFFIELLASFYLVVPLLVSVVFFYD